MALSDIIAWQEQANGTYRPVKINPIPMSSLSTPVKTVVDAITARNSDQAAFISTIATQSDIAALTAGSPAQLNTFLEAYNQFIADEAAVAALTSIVSGKQPLDADLTAIAALSTTSFGRGLLTLTDGPSAVSAIGAATLAQGALAATAVQPEAGISYLRNKVTTTNATATLLASLAIAVNTCMFVDCIATFQGTATHLVGGYIWATLAFARGPSGTPVACGTIDLLSSQSLAVGGVTFVPNVTTGNVDIFVTGILATNISWSVRTKVDRNNP